MNAKDGCFIPLPRWLCEQGPEADVVISTRCRLARNLSGYTFPWRADEMTRREVARLITVAACNAGGDLSQAICLDAELLSEAEHTRLIEWRYASGDWPRLRAGGRLLIPTNGICSVMVNEEEHLRVQAILPGLQVESVLYTAEMTEDRLGSTLAFARDRKTGYLTTSLSNAGAGLRISVLLHLPGLAVSDGLEEALDAAEGLGCAVRGLYGEGSSGAGELYQISNSSIWGDDAVAVAHRVASAVKWLIQSEREARQNLFDQDRGSRELAEAAKEALSMLLEQRVPSRKLLSIISVLRLAVSQGIMPGDLVQTSGWLAMAGPPEGDGINDQNPYEWSRSRAIRQALQSNMKAIGTFYSFSTE